MRIIERPTRQTRRPLASAARMIESIRATLEAKQAAATLPFRVPISLLSTSRTSASEPASPSTKTLVESQTMASTPSSPSRRMASWSVGAPSSGSGSIFQSPVCRIVPSGVLIARPLGSGIEWVRVIRVDLERPEPDRARERNLGDPRLIEQALLAQLLAQQEGGERRGVEGRLQPGPQPAHGADVVLVGVGQDDAEDVLGVLLDEGRVGQDDLDARRGLVAEGHAQVDHDPLAGVGRAVAVEVEVHADLVRAAQRQEDEFVARDSGWETRYGEAVIQPPDGCSGGRFRAGRGW